MARNVIGKALAGAAPVATAWALSTHKANLMKERDTALARIAKDNTLSAEGRATDRQIATEGRAGKTQIAKEGRANAEYATRQKNSATNLKSYVNAEFKAQEEAGIYKGDENYRTTTMIERDILKERLGGTAEPSPEVTAPPPEEEGPGMFSKAYEGAKDLVSGAMDKVEEPTPKGGRKGRQALAEARTESKAEGETARGGSELQAAKNAVLKGKSGRRPASKKQKDLIIQAMLDNPKNKGIDPIAILEGLINRDDDIAKAVRGRAKARLAELRGS